jgi:ribulose-phosphate 3-epimerase
MDKIDLALVMTVEPGFGGQSFMADMMPKVSKIRQMIKDRNLTCELEVDGGVNTDTAKVCVAAGADVLVAGSSVFKASDRENYIKGLRG